MSYDKFSCHSSHMRLWSPISSWELMKILALTGYVGWGNPDLPKGLYLCNCWALTTPCHGTRAYKGSKRVPLSHNFVGMTMKDMRKDQWPLYVQVEEIKLRWFIFPWTWCRVSLMDPWLCGSQAIELPWFSFHQGTQT